MHDFCLAIPSVPAQTWNEIYELPKALEEGTIFPELNLPFFAAPENSNETLPKSEDPKMMFTRICFALDDALLYLDTHPKDKKAKDFYRKCLEKKKELMAGNACGCASSAHYEWEKLPLVWEGGHC